MGKDPVAVAVARVAAASRKQRGGSPVTIKDGLLEEARAELIAARLEKAIDEALAPVAPYEPLREEDRNRLGVKLLGF